MYCSKCGQEFDRNTGSCPRCGQRVNNGDFPVWAIVLVILIVSLPVALCIIGIVAAITLPTLINNTNSAKFKAIYKKELSTVNQALILSEVQNDKIYSDFDDVWKLGIKANLMNPGDIENGIILADGSEIKYEKTGKPCVKLPESPTRNTACAILTIDGNGFDKLPNKRTEKDSSGAYNHVNDQFEILLYASGAKPESGSVEEDILN